MKFAHGETLSITATDVMIRPVESPGARTYGGIPAGLFTLFRNNLPPNCVRHAAVMAAYFATQSISYFETNFTGKIKEWGNVGIVGATACYLAWAILLTPAGETRPQEERGTEKGRSKKG